jgi:hypothetical protein
MHDQLRSTFPRVRSMLMDRQTFLDHDARRPRSRRNADGHRDHLDFRLDDLPAHELIPALRAAYAVISASWLEDGPTGFADQLFEQVDSA